MRKSRQKTITETGYFHKMWQGHNREHVLGDNTEKNAYLKHLNDTFTDDIKDAVIWFAFCLMNNHTHEVGKVKKDKDDSFKPAIKELGNWMRNGHSRFGSEYNRRHDRKGKVAYDRPKTKEIEDLWGVLQVMFYCDANPVRAGQVSHPSRYKYSSYRFYAFGQRSAHSSNLTPPDAYLRLGSTPSVRQKRYRSLCDKYLRNLGLIDDAPDEDTVLTQTLRQQWDDYCRCDCCGGTKSDPPTSER